MDVDDTNDKELLFPPRPTPKPNPYPLEFQRKGFHANSSVLKHASDINVIAVAEVIKSISDNMKGKTPLDTVPNLARVVNTLLDLSNPLAQLLIENRLHEVFLPNRDPNLKLPNLVSEESKEQPHCYGMAHCTSLGVPPTNAEYLRLIRIVKNYINNTPPSADWAALDTVAKEIDCFEPAGRTWSGEYTRNGVTFIHRHPRRYCFNENQRKAIIEAITALEKRLDKVADLNTPLQFSLTYIGWSRIFPTRRDQHYRHQGQNAVKYLSILCCSYSSYGGLNGTTAGGGGAEATAERHGTDTTWLNGVDQSIQQGVFDENFEALKKDHEMRKFLNDYYEEGSELVELKAERERALASKKQLDVIIKASAETYGRWAQAQEDLLTEELKLLELEEKLDSLMRLNKALQKSSFFKKKQ